MTSQEYWAKREAEQLRHNITDEKEYDKQIARIYSDMLDACQSEINAFYGKYAAQEGITIAEAKKRVSKLDIAAYERKAKRYVKDKDFSAKANEEMRLYNAAMKINRLEMLKANIGLELISGHDELEKFMSGILQDRTEDELKRQAGILGETVKKNAAKAHAIVNASFHSGTFSDRIWQYQDLMREDLAKVLTDGLIRGKNPRAIARDMRKVFYGGDPKKVGGYRYCIERLMRTELARVQTEAQKQSFERNGFEQYTFIVNGGCCDICEGLKGKIFPVAKMMPGENAPPMHPHCRCSTAAYSDRKEYDEWLDHLANGGTTEEFEKLKKAKVNTLLTKESGKSGIIQTGGKYAVGSFEWNVYRNEKADLYYANIRNANDIETVAKSAGMTVEEIRTIKNHIFYDKHIKYDGKIERFDADYDMAVAWKRLTEGNPNERDVLLLKHELLESELEKAQKLTAAEAHEIANKTYAWDKKLNEELGEGGESDDLL
jgi:SPP1 gp7 family putative phage head morphogenesis protein